MEESQDQIMTTLVPVEVEGRDNAMQVNML